MLRGRARGVPRLWIPISGRRKDGEGGRHARSWRPMTGDVSESLSQVGPRRLDLGGTAGLFVPWLVFISFFMTSHRRRILVFSSRLSYPFIKVVFSIFVIIIIMRSSYHHHIFSYFLKPSVLYIDLSFFLSKASVPFSSIRRHTRAEVQCNCNLGFPSALRSNSRADVIFRLPPLSAEAAGEGRRPFASRAVSGAAPIHRSVLR